MRKPIIIASLLLCAAVFAPEVRAGEIADKAAQAEEHLAAARYEEAMKALEEAQDKLWATAPLMFRRHCSPRASLRATGYTTCARTTYSSAATS